MGKQLHRRRSSLPFHNNSGCMWGVLHLLDYEHWRGVKKMLLHKRRGSGRQNGMGSNINGSKSGRTEDHPSTEDDNSNLAQKRTPSDRSTKSSVKTRIKSLIAEEMSTKKNRHSRSSSYPARAQLMRTYSIHRSEPPDKENFGEVIPNGEDTIIDLKEDKICSSRTAEQRQLQVNEERGRGNTFCETCGSMLPVTCDIGNSPLGDHEGQRVETNRLLQEKLDKTKQVLLEQQLIYAKELTRDASLYQSKEFMDALGLISMTKDLFLQVLQDPAGSSLTHRFHGQKQYGPKFELTKCGTFPIGSSSGRRDTGESEPKQEPMGSHSEGRRESQICCHTQSSAGFKSTEKTISFRSIPSSAAARMNKASKSCQVISEAVDGYSPVMDHFVTDKSGNQAAIKRFRHLQQKLKVVIKEDEKERHRISMDAIFDKVPCGHGVSSDLRGKEPAVDIDPMASPGSHCSSYGSHQSSPASSKVGSRRFKRATSLRETLDQYCHLFELSCNREPKSPTSERLKRGPEEGNLSGEGAPKPLTRIGSLPDLKSHFHLGSEGSCEPLSAGVQLKAGPDSTRSMPSSSCELKIQDIPLEWDSENSMLLKFVTEDQEPKPKKGVELGDVTAEAIHSLHEHDVDVSSTEISAVKNSDPCLESLPVAAEESMQEVPERGELHGGVETPRKLREGSIQHLHVDTKDKAEFNYVKDVLELSGFCRNETLGTWHSSDQPVDPSVFTEVEGCLLDGSDPFENEEFGNSNHLLLFDLINEVLMATYERSLAYCPMLLSPLSHFRPMPSGHHVLGEVWSSISQYLQFQRELDQSVDYTVNQDLSRDYGWMNLRFDAECVGLEVEDLIFGDLVEETILT